MIYAPSIIISHTPKRANNLSTPRHNSGQSCAMGDEPIPPGKSVRRKRRKTSHAAATWMDSVSNLPDLAALFTHPQSREEKSRNFDGASSLLEDEAHQDSLALDNDEDDQEGAIARIATGPVDNEERDPAAGQGHANMMDEDHCRVVEDLYEEEKELIDLIDAYAQGPFPEVSLPENLDVEHDENEASLQSSDMLVQYLTDGEHDVVEVGQPSMALLRSSDGVTTVRSAASDVKKAIKELRSSRKLFIPWTNLLSFVTVCGSVRFTVKQYNFLRDILRWVAPTVSLPSYSSVQRNTFPFVLKHCFPGSELKYFDVRRKAAEPQHQIGRREEDDENAGQHGDGSSGQTSPNDINATSGRIPVRIVRPSEWAKLDIAMAPLFHSMYPEPGRWGKAISDVECIESSPIVTHRHVFTEATRSIYVHDGVRAVQAFPGSTIRLNLGRMKSEDISVDVSALGYRVHENDSSDHVMKAAIAAVWCIGAEGFVTNSAQFALRNVEGLENLLVKRCCTAAPLAKQNRITRTNRGLDFESRLISARTLLPGDICALLRPKVTEAVSRYACILVSRFWKHQDGLASEMLFWYNMSSISGPGHQTIAEEQVNKAALRVLGIQDVRGRPILLRPPMPSTPPNVRMTNNGYLADGRKFVVYRILLYCDDFRPFTTIYPQGSAGGCYMIPLGLPRQVETSVQGCESLL